MAIYMCIAKVDTPVNAKDAWDKARDNSSNGRGQSYHDCLPLGHVSLFVGLQVRLSRTLQNATFLSRSAQAQCRKHNSMTGSLAIDMAAVPANLWW